MSGQLIGVVGPSGVGKDSVMDGLVRAVPGLHRVKRTITRAPGLGGEDYEPVSEAEFEARAAAGDFCLHWQAHGLHYGVPATLKTRIAQGEHALVNLSRSILLQAQAVFPGLVTLNITASPEVLLGRLQTRGRETIAGIDARLARAAQPLPMGVRAININNDGALADTIATARAVLFPDEATQ
ncbi:phosphonate metabolism protein/1,5-bisphosphokinase (PRPP-forming) PhnN [Cognatishimia sp. SS12]|uniref:phosphonate metabolism protein/1,5-bisphosphokinase (PRPP-forming) PhnN n=1 Tax=Cognatishimia sp. SS12 TaxID=2979465 RepID=UPI00232E24C0|nr:phosphonate metabolism protein/1,5-bisphosphokinase (PRPP-forming) PhnN [Cognatishimia sp. SS12]MDC0738684.1 phosphonate metabolism protein/1,5-bisphosphokinase (PRPP-forming) PhnN [Cognatishimia sp. SS12]